MADVSKIQLPNGTSVNIKDARIPSATSSDEGKVVMVNSSGQLVITALPIYNGAVMDDANGGSF